MPQKNIVMSEDRKINESFSENALKVMKKRYLFTDEKGHEESPAQMLHRVARSLAEVEKNYGHDEKDVKKIEKDFFEIMSKKEFTPAGRTLTNVGTPTALIANCIVLPIHDSMESIFGTLKDSALLQQAGSGLGFSLDELRPSMSPTKKSRGFSSGSISFLKVYNEAFGTIKQQGRHGANMAMMSVDHPDILDFIRSKEVEGEIRNFNISVKVTDEFMQQVIDSPNTQWYCSWRGEKLKPRKVLRHSNGSVYGCEELDITVGQMFDEIIHYAWLNGEPGIVFIDNVNKNNPLPGLGKIECSNPCGEQFLHAYDNCNLGSINLAVFMKDKKVNYARLRFVTKTAVRLMDNVIDKFDFPVSQVTELAVKNRRIGLGIMGFADMLYELGVKYNSQKGLAAAERVMGAIQDAAHEASMELAKEKGEFPNMPMSVFKDKGIKMRNTALTTVAPTGSISMMFDSSSGIEPNFALSFVKQDKDGTKYHYLNKYFDEELKKRRFPEEKIAEIKAEVTRTGSIQSLTWLPQDLRDTFVISMDMSGEDHVRMQAAFQKHVDNSISKTINFPNSATHDDIKNGYIMAWKLGCKSCTAYRDGSRNIQVLNLGTGENIVSMTESGAKKKTQNTNEPALNLEIDRGKLSPRVRPAVMSGKTYKIKTGYGNLYITINNDESNAPFEVFATIGKSGGFFQEQSEGICRLISLALRVGIKVEEIISDLKGIRGPMPVMTNKGTVLSLPDAIARILEEHVQVDIKPAELPEMPKVLEHSPAVVMAKSGPVTSGFVESSIAETGMMPGCPDCGEKLKISEGCLSCHNCGFSRCM